MNKQPIPQTDLQVADKAALLEVALSELEGINGGHAGEVHHHHHHREASLNPQPLPPRQDT